MKKIILNDYQKNPIHVYIYEPETKIKAVIQVIHGASEHFARYGLFAEFLTKNGYLVIGCDILSHGLSAKTLEYVHFADKNGDILAYESVVLVKEYIEKNYPEQDVYVLGHSMGSFLARKLILDFPDFYKKAVISGTAYVPQFLISVVSFLIKTIRLFKGPKYISKFIIGLSVDKSLKTMRKDGIIGKRDVEWLSRDKKIQDYYENSKMCGQPFTLQANLDMYQWVSFVNKKQNINSGNKNMPILLISGANDALGGYGKDIEKLFNTMKSLGYKFVEMKIYPEDRHEILNELNKEEVYQDILNFLS